MSHWKKNCSSLQLSGSSLQQHENPLNSCFYSDLEGSSLWAENLKGEEEQELQWGFIPVGKLNDLRSVRRYKQLCRSLTLLTAGTWFSWTPVVKMIFTSLYYKQSVGHTVDKIVCTKDCYLPSKSLTVKEGRGKKKNQTKPHASPNKKQSNTKTKAKITTTKKGAWQSSF